MSWLASVQNQFVEKFSHATCRQGEEKECARVENSRSSCCFTRQIEKKSGWPDVYIDIDRDPTLSSLCSGLEETTTSIS